MYFKTLFISIISFFLISSTYAKAFLPKSFSAKFEQSHKSALSGKVKKTNGTVDYKFPGNIRFETKGENRIVFVSNQKKTWYYTAPFIEGEPGELSINPTSKNVLSRFFDVLRKGLKSNKLYSVKKGKAGHNLEFSKKTSKELGLKSATIKFKKGSMKFSQIESLTLTYNDKKKVKMTLAGIKINPKLTKSKFTFKAPDNTRINK